MVSKELALAKKQRTLLPPEYKELGLDSLLVNPALMVVMQKIVYLEVKLSIILTNLTALLSPRNTRAI